VSEADRDKWETRYRERTYVARSYPSPFLERWIDRFPRGRALDVACGAGRNALRLAEAGFAVDAMDISTAALERAAAAGAQRRLHVNWLQADLDTVVLEPGAYALITVIRYMNRALSPRIVPGLAPDGWLLFEHHFQTAEDVDGPGDTRFRLEPQELLRSFRSLRVVHYEELITEDRDGRRMALERLVGCAGDAGF
jgi:SAM-dependent methyltransferase